MQIEGHFFTKKVNRYLEWFRSSGLAGFVTEDQVQKKERLVFTNAIGELQATRTSVNAACASLRILPF